jgi:hypothetical protein
MIKLFHTIFNSIMDYMEVTTSDIKQPNTDGLNTTRLIDTRIKN